MLCFLLFFYLHQLQNPLSFGGTVQREVDESIRKIPVYNLEQNFANNTPLFGDPFKLSNIARRLPGRIELEHWIWK